MDSMSSVSDSNVPQGDPGQQPEKPFLGVVFIGPNGLRAGWRLSIYIVLVVVLGYVVVQAIRHIPALDRYFSGAQRGELAPVGLIVSEITVAFAVLAAAWIMSLIEKRPFGVYGMPLSQAFGKRFWEGMLWGIVTISLVIGLIAAVGAYSFGPLALAGSAIFRNAVLWLIGFSSSECLKSSRFAVTCNTRSDQESVSGRRLPSSPRCSPRCTSTIPARALSAHQRGCNCHFLLFDAAPHRQFMVRDWIALQLRLGRD